MLPYCCQIKLQRSLTIGADRQEYHGLKKERTDLSFYFINMQKSGTQPVQILFLE